MIKLVRNYLLISVLLSNAILTFSQENASELIKLGYSIIPTPQKVNLNGKETVIDNSWKIVSEVNDNHIALNRLKEGASELHKLIFSNTGSKQIVLKIKKDVVRDISDEKNKTQAYKLNISAKKIVIEGNGDAGLFYGVQSFLQLLKSNDHGKYAIPSGTIIDWPQLELRIIHWDTKHNRGRMKDLKRYIDWAAYFKVNAIAFEIEDKYEYPSHPVIGGPNALTKSEMISLTKYASDHFIQLIPDIQSPAHMGYVLKHEEFAHLRSDGSNYQICLCDEEAVKLVQDIYQDIMDATPGVDYLFVSTDEVYYPGACDKCTQPYNEINKSQYWVDFVNTIHKWLNGRRRMLVWMEYPLLAKDIPSIPSDIINGVTYPNRNQDFVDQEYELGISQLSYSSLQGVEWLFPNYFDYENKNAKVSGRLENVSKDVRGLLKIKNHLMGNFAAAWDDSGLNSETFWLGWVSASQYGWNPNGPSVEQITYDFMDIFYGKDAIDMFENYKVLQLGAHFYDTSWERKEVLSLPLIYGRYDSIYQFPRKRPFMNPPAMPTIENGKITTTKIFSDKYDSIIVEAKRIEPLIDKMISSLKKNLVLVNYNAQNIEVLLSIASLEKHFIDMVFSLAQVEDLLEQASIFSKNKNRIATLEQLEKANTVIKSLLNDRTTMWTNLTATWERGRLPKNVNPDRAPYLHILDDVKDHVADKTLGIEYMIEPMLEMKLDVWQMELESIIEKY